MKHFVLATSLVFFAGAVNAEQGFNFSAMHTDLDQKVSHKFEQTVNDAYFEVDNSWIIDEVVVVGKRTAPEFNSHGSNLFDSDNDSWSFSVSLD